ncbi:MAG: OmpH family outer membrane protein [Bacteroidales bacterium]|nr:OmpH family outer membrane protein [Bacteroidales bacterium]MDZ4204559.1 OmpH family outer membrane protein [Bacteroidales bacterium]
MNEIQESFVGEPNNLPTQPSSKKQSYQTGLNIFLLVGLGVLFILHVTEKKTSQNKEQGPAVAENLNRVPSIAFINSDSIMVHYELVKDMRKLFEASTKRKENELKAQQKTFEGKVSEYQRKLNSNAISGDIAQITEQQLMKEQQRLVDFRDELTEELAREEYELNIQLLDSVTNFLVRYNQAKQYDAVFNFKQGSTIFIRNDAMDITPEVLEKLNDEYRLKTPPKK